jgi:hypothetical protein
MGFGVQFRCKKCNGLFEDLSQHACIAPPTPPKPPAPVIPAAKAKRNKRGRPSLNEPWRALGIGRRAYFYRKKAGKL